MKVLGIKSSKTELSWIVMQGMRGTRLVVQSLCGLGLMGRGPL